MEMGMEMDKPGRVESSRVVSAERAGKQARRGLVGPHFFPLGGILSPSKDSTVAAGAHKRM